MGGSGSDGDAALGVVEDARQALIDGKPAKVCALFTPRARKNSLGTDSNYYKTNPAGDHGGDVPRPKTCPRAVADQLDFARRDGEDPKKGIEENTRTIKVVRVRGRRAHVRVGEDMEVYLLKRRSGWRIDYADFSPLDGTSGY